MLSRACYSLCWAGLVLGTVAGCQPAIRSVDRESEDVSLFGPTDIRIHPFTSVKDWSGEGRPDGVEVLIELLDRMHDPTKATGTVVFELYQYRRNFPDPRGERLAAWRGTLLSLEDQRMHYNRISRTYSFQLAYPEIRKDKSYVLQVWFEHGGRRLSSQVVLEMQEQPGVVPTTNPLTTQPATRPAETRPVDTRPAGGPTPRPPAP